MVGFITILEILAIFLWAFYIVDYQTPPRLKSLHCYPFKMFLLNDCGSTACSVPICHCFTCHCWNSLMFWLTSWNSVFGGQDLQLGKMLMVSRDGILSGNSSLDGWLLGNIVEVWRHVPLKKAPHLVGIWTVSIQVTAPPPNFFALQCALEMRRQIHVWAWCWSQSCQEVGLWPWISHLTSFGLIF